jgi:beta-glucosidase/6-phospho-beta-glucosidase/beta-galactosidase
LNGATGKAGITLNINWYDPKDNQTSSQEAAERAMQFLGGWFANPIFGDGGYPAVMRQKVIIPRRVISKTYQMILRVVSIS